MLVPKYSTLIVFPGCASPQPVCLDFIRQTLIYSRTLSRGDTQASQSPATEQPAPQPCVASFHVGAERGRSLSSPLSAFRVLRATLACTGQTSFRVTL